jgi:precorrin-8X/cobalt-precorrin-8 methylmutase
MNIFTGDKLSNSYAICLIGHGSRDPEGVQEFLTLSQKIHEKEFCDIVEPGFLEFSKPTAAKALSACKRNGVNNIIILPGILFSGEHTQRDIPRAAKELLKNHPGSNLIFAKPLATHPKVIEACQKRIEKEEKKSPKPFSRSETLFMTIGHGSRDTSFNSEVEKVLSKLGEKMGFSKTTTFFAGISHGSLEDLQKNFSLQEFRRVILMPFFLFSGVWVKRIYTLAETFQSKYPDTEIIKIPCLSHHDLIVDALIQRARESVSDKST